MRISTVLPVEDWRACADAARRAEEEGFDSVQSNELRHDPFVPLAFAALATNQAQLATSVAIAFPRSPMIVANLTWDLHRHSRGRFVIGLGSQVRAHNERRFSIPWTAPAERMGEYVQALRAIFRCWEYGEKLSFQGKHYTFTLMTPEFTPPRAGLPLPPVAVAAVGPLMTRTAARFADSIRLHGFATRAYLERVVMPQIRAELDAAGKKREAFEIGGGGFIATGPNDEAVKQAAEKIRYRIAFYGSTPAYRGVLDVHGLSDLGARLHQMSREGKWKEMPAQISDEVLDLFTARAPYEGIAEAISQRFGGLTDSVALDFLPDDSPATRRSVIEAVRGIPHSFRGFQTENR